MAITSKTDGTIQRHAVEGLSLPDIKAFLGQTGIDDAKGIVHEFTGDSQTRRQWREEIVKHPRAFALMDKLAKEYGFTGLIPKKGIRFAAFTIDENNLKMDEGIVLPDYIRKDLITDPNGVFCPVYNRMRVGPEMLERIEYLSSIDGELAESGLRLVLSHEREHAVGEGRTRMVSLDGIASKKFFQRRDARAERGAEVGALKKYGEGTEKTMDYFALRYAFSELIDLTPQQHQDIVDGRANEPTLGEDISRFHRSIIEETVGVDKLKPILDRANEIVHGFYDKARKKERS
ncbi:MAG: hypothetical protein KKD39_04860 [Candidatus Altiarchaeota archaeon]|nr:hypothetical protein [Candidatus Altiarchaeota archaeon]